ncbi:MAG: methyl-accepting chemotaxis protein, partial [Clostridiaceae bacterium]|nr:methyl-accepting chemotaxis protein [Clostridiaceae bacterium]
MKLFENLKTAQKLIFSFILVSIFIVIVGGIGILNMKTIKENSNSMHDYNFESIKQLSVLKSNLGDIRSDLLKLNYQRNINNQNEQLEKEI